MTKHIYRDPTTGRFAQHPNSVQLSKRKAEEHFLALTIIYVVCFCTIALIIAITMLFIQFQMLKDLVNKNSMQIRELTLLLQETDSAELVIGEDDLSLNIETPIVDEEKPRPLVRVFRGSEVTEE